MESRITDSLRQGAIEWHIRLRHGDDESWEAFAEWLAQDPRHQQAYDEVEQADLAIEPLLAGLQFREAANDVAEDDEAGDTRHAPARLTPTRRWSLAGGALAAGIAAAILVAPQFWSERYTIDTGPGQTREITLGASTRIILNGSTRITLDRKNARFAALESGEALFHVRHDPARPFRLQVGDAQVQDVGTIFDVVRDTQEVRVAVAEGSVSYAAVGGATPLGVGQALTDRGGTVQVAATSTAAVGGWQAGRLVYSAQPLTRVAGDLSRSLGVGIAVSPALGDRPFSGSIILDPGASATDQRQRLAAALDVSLEAEAQGWTMKPRTGAGR